MFCNGKDFTFCRKIANNVLVENCCKTAVSNLMLIQLFLFA